MAQAEGTRFCRKTINAAINIANRGAEVIQPYAVA